MSWLGIAHSIKLPKESQMAKRALSKDGTAPATAAIDPAELLPTPN
jgi:hypothetical protein